MKKYNFAQLIIFGTLLFMSVLANAQSNENRIIDYARKIQAVSLDSTLPNQPIEVWLKSLVGSKDTILWEVNDCGEQTGAPGDSSIDFPMCVEIVSNSVDGRRIGIQIAVGTYKTGINGIPQVIGIYIDNHSKYRYLKKLRDLQALLENR
ncbi:MAG: hypothetical protein ABSD46_06345 [Bacteroidota bacterium]